ncbi:hypothetical protein MAH1_04330 [Sessilibacter sp. MAH1]
MDYTGEACPQRNRAQSVNCTNLSAVDRVRKEGAIKVWIYKFLNFQLIIAFYNNKILSADNELK